MSSGLLITLEISLVLGGLIALAVWELISLRRYRERERHKQAQAQTQAEAQGQAQEAAGQPPPADR